MVLYNLTLSSMNVLLLTHTQPHTLIHLSRVPSAYLTLTYTYPTYKAPWVTTASTVKGDPDVSP